MTEHHSAEKVRLDKWLWAARFFKTRPLATEAVTGGKVYVNGARAKPGRPVSVGDEVVIRRGPYLFDVMVRGIASRRGPAPLASQLYEETDESRENRARLSAQLEEQQGLRAEQRGRPHKRDRRMMIRFLRRRR